MPVFKNTGLKTQGLQKLSYCHTTYQMYEMGTQEVLGPPLYDHQLDQAI